MELGLSTQLVVSGATKLAVAPCVAPLNTVVTGEELVVCVSELEAELVIVPFDILSLCELSLA